eukprot:gnl/TRDRNA2_/TRDRNA2_173916_c0_seq7.p2 gnl/TRDRNA2_/TRDRNA2_173916_c0~~gnl/TRDRNA2_/TRDRNA2_173916_c0_seq7.p2  ORF type:complete len:104 (-),score=6.90 gnl/TRDRNA2_/TRDRNA2_173916_c0_seq7:43-354(-)
MARAVTTVSGTSSDPVTAVGTVDIVVGRAAVMPTAEVVATGRVGHVVAQAPQPPVEPAMTVAVVPHHEVLHEAVVQQLYCAPLKEKGNKHGSPATPPKELEMV